MPKDLQLIVGLGNPGADYEYTRHNLGFLAVRFLAEKFELKFMLSSLTNGLTAEGKIDGRSVCLLLPLTYMNKSGVAVKQVVKQKGIALDNILIVCDDLNLDFGDARLRAKGTDGGNNGLKSIIECLETKQFSRLRLGIGKPKSKNQTVDYVLEEFSKKEKKQLDEFIDTAANCCMTWLDDGVGKAMDQFNRRKVKEKNE